MNLRGTASLLVALTVPLGGAVALRGLVGHPVVVQGPSMKPLLRDGSLVWVDRLSLRWRAPRLGELVAYEDPSRGLLVKRVVGLPGDTVEVRNALVRRNGEEPASRPVGHVENWRNATRVLPIDRLFAEVVEERLGRPHRILRVSHSQGIPPVAVPPNCVFLLGDNRDDSLDSRSFGPVPMNRLVGRIVAPSD